MKTVFRWIMMAFAGITPLAVLAQSDPGPATGGGINRSYDDGYVYVDSTGDRSGFTSDWGCQNSFQIQGGFVIFHSESYLDANTVQMITDSYDIGSLIPPPAPYSGTSSGLGFVIPDAPFSRSVQDIVVPEPSSVVMLSMGLLLGMACNRKVKTC